MPASPNSTPAPEILRPIIESEIERLIAILDGLDADPDLEETADSEPWLGWNDASNVHSGDDRELDTCDDEPSLGSIEVKLPPPTYRMVGDHGHCLFPAMRERGELSYSAAGFCQMRWSAGSNADVEDEHDGAEPCCEDEGAQCDDEGVRD